MALLDRIKSGLAKTRNALGRGLEPVLETLDRLDPTAPELGQETIDSLEEALLAADVGVEGCDALVERVKNSRPRTRDELEQALTDAVAVTVSLGPTIPFTAPPGVKPWVVLVVGVNGSGKTTLIGKLAAREVASGKRVLVVAADTFRAAATEQLETWAERAGATIVSQRTGSDPAAVAHDGISSAVAKGHDTVLIDTAGRLHTHTNLMEELAKIKRVIQRLLPGAPHETLLVLDGTVGQNGIAQARQFHDSLELTAVAVNKLDGTARGGSVVAVARELGIPVRLVGIGESIADLEDFEPASFAEGLVKG